MFPFFMRVTSARSPPPAGDVLIFNDQGILKNDALKLLEPVPTFGPRLNEVDDTSTKPCLAFRMTDADMVDDPQVRRLLRCQ